MTNSVEEGLDYSALETVWGASRSANSTSLIPQAIAKDFLSTKQCKSYYSWLSGLHFNGSCMEDYEAHINTKFGSLVIHFTDKADLEKKLQDVASLAQTIEGHPLSAAAVKEEDVAGLEGICKMSGELPRILVYPDTGSDKIRLALYASKNGLTSEEITRVTGVRNPTANRVMKFDEVHNSAGRYTLSGEGRTYFTGQVLPELKKRLQPATNTA